MNRKKLLNLSGDFTGKYATVLKEVAETGNDEEVDLLIMDAEKKLYEEKQLSSSYVRQNRPFV